MPGSTIDGKEAAAEVRAKVASAVERHKESGGTVKALAVVEVGDNPASKVYIRMKERAAREVGFDFMRVSLPPECTQQQLEDQVRQLNDNPAVAGFLVQSPVPDHLDEPAILDIIDPAKDVDGFNPINQGRLFLGKDGMVPCTPRGVMYLLDREGVELKGAHAVVVGRSHLVGRPMALLLLHRHCTVSICHSRTRDLGAITSQADILVSAVGRPRIITGDMVKKGAVCIDVGINRIEDPSHPKGGYLVGDLDFDPVMEVASKVTPVPGGVGPMTVAMLMVNTAKAANIPLKL